MTVTLYTVGGGPECVDADRMLALEDLEHDRGRLAVCEVVLGHTRDVYAERATIPRSVILFGRGQIWHVMARGLSWQMTLSTLRQYVNGTARGRFDGALFITEGVLLEKKLSDGVLVELDKVTPTNRELAEQGEHVGVGFYSTPGSRGAERFWKAPIVNGRIEPFVVSKDFDGSVGPMSNFFDTKDASAARSN